MRQVNQKRKAALKLIDELELLLEKYSKELRASTQPYQLQRIESNVPNFEYHPESLLVRETLIEHVGSLPIVAAAFYPYIQDSEVDLGQALIMLAVHDIGELSTGDQMVFTKKADKALERQAALELLHEYYHDAYQDIESQTSKSAKFAKAIDKITPDILDYLTPADITIWRFQHFVGIGTDKIIDLIVKHKRPYMLWSPFITEFHKALLERLSEKLKKSGKF